MIPGSAGDDRSLPIGTSKATISGEATVIHQIPHELKGIVGVWPAASSKPSISRWTVGRSSSSSRAEPAKPTLQTQIEDFIRNELKTRGCSHKPGNKPRLSVYREAFEIFMDEFPNYRPLLWQIKNEYEAMLEVTEKKIESLPGIMAELEQQKAEVICLRENGRRWAED